MGAVFALFSAWYFWIPKILGLDYNKMLGKVHFWIMFIGVNVTFFPQHFLGLQGMPRRISDYPDAFAGWNMVSSIGSLTSVVATWLFLHILYKQLTIGKATSRYPWLTPQFYSDILQTLLNRSYNSLEWCLNSPPKPHAFVSLPLQSKVNIKFSNLKDKFTLKNICITLVSIVFAYLLKLYLSYLLILDTNTCEHFILLGFIASYVRPFFKDLFEIIIPTVYCMDENIEESIAAQSGSNPGASASASTSAPAPATATAPAPAPASLAARIAARVAAEEAAGNYNRYFTPREADNLKDFVRETMADDDPNPFTHGYTAVDYLKDLRECAEEMTEQLSDMHIAKCYFNAVEDGWDTVPVEKEQYNILKNKFTAEYDDSQPWRGRKMDFNDPENVKIKFYQDYREKTRLLSIYQARVRHLEQLGENYITDNGNLTAIADSLVQVNRRTILANAKLIRTIVEDSDREIEKNTRRY